MKMTFVLNDNNARELGYTVEACYEVINRLFAEYGIVPVQQGVYCGSDNQNTYDACSAALHRLPTSSWFLKVIERWKWTVNDGEEPEDCLKSYYETH